MSMFRKATRKATKLRIGLVGPSGSGKTMTALRLAMGLAPGGKIAVIDTEGGSSELYSDQVVPEGSIAFDVAPLESFHPQRFIDAIKAAGEAGYDVLIVDSLSHAWTEGVLLEVDKAAARGRTCNTYTAWKDVTPLHNALVNAILRAPMHVICTMRAKTEYIMEEDSRGKQVPKKVGLAPVQRAGMEYEFTVVADIDLDDNTMLVSKTRCSALSGGVYPQAGADVAEVLRDWLESGESVREYLGRALLAHGLTLEDFDSWSQGRTDHPQALDDYTDGQMYRAAQWIEAKGGPVVRKWQADRAQKQSTDHAPQSAAQDFVDAQIDGGAS